jgi:hypothetical protein
MSIWGKHPIHSPTSDPKSYASGIPEMGKIPYGINYLTMIESKLEEDIVGLLNGAEHVTRRNIDHGVDCIWLGDASRRDPYLDYLAPLSGLHRI